MKEYQSSMWHTKYGHSVHMRVSEPASGGESHWGESCSQRKSLNFPISKNRMLPARSLVAINYEYEENVTMESQSSFL